MSKCVSVSQLPGPVPAPVDIGPHWTEGQAWASTPCLPSSPSRSPHAGPGERTECPCLLVGPDDVLGTLLPKAPATPAVAWDLCRATNRARDELEPCLRLFTLQRYFCGELKHSVCKPTNNVECECANFITRPTYRNWAGNSARHKLW